MKFSIKDFFSKCDQIRKGTWSYLLKKFLMGSFIFLCKRVKTKMARPCYASYERDKIKFCITFIQGSGI